MNECIFGLFAHFSVKKKEHDGKKNIEKENRHNCEPPSVNIKKKRKNWKRDIASRKPSFSKMNGSL